MPVARAGYCVIKGPTPESLEEQVREFLCNGWELAGGLVVANLAPPGYLNPAYFQAVYYRVGTRGEFPNPTHEKEPK